MHEPHLHPALGMRGLLLLVAAILPVMFASMLGQLFTAPALSGWYLRLNKPWFTPPNILFPLVWTLLYALMAVALWRILRAKPELGPKRAAIGLFALQLVLNVMWSWGFFWKQSPSLGLLIIGALALAIAATIRAFSHLDRASALALWPYLAWVLFASLLNGAIAYLNP